MYNLQITAYQAKNYKSFIDTGWIRIKPITLAFGHNSSGKSAMLTVLPMLQQTIEDPNTQTPFVFASEHGVDLGSYEEVVYQHKVSLENPVRINIELENIEKSVYTTRESYYSARILKSLSDLGVEPNKIQIEVAAAYNKKQRQIAITEFYIRANETPILKIYRKTTAANQPWHYEPSILEEFDPKVSWLHFFPRLLTPLRVIKPSENKRGVKSQPFNDLTLGLFQVINENLRYLSHIGPLREFPKRAYRLTGESPRDVGQQGENWLYILLRLKPREKLIDNVNGWLERLGYSLYIEWGKQGYVHPMLKDRRGLDVSLKDTGFGISQILPVLIQGFSSPPGTILILEQPEIHLHPQAQAELGDILIAISRRGVRLLVETHSEHLLLRLQRRIAENYFQEKPEIKPEDLAIYFVEQEVDCSQVHEVLLNSKGEFINPPDQLSTFFSNDYTETMQWSQTLAKIAKESNEHSN